MGSIRDYGGATIGLVELSVDRSGTLHLIDCYRQLMLGIGILGMILSVGAIYLVSRYFTEPIAKMVAFAREIAGSIIGDGDLTAAGDSATRNPARATRSGERHFWTDARAAPCGRERS